MNSNQKISVFGSHYFETKKINSLSGKNLTIDKLSTLLPFDLIWNDINGNRCVSIHQVFFLLDKNYIEDCYSFLRFNYVHEFIRFAICGPQWTVFLNLGLKFNRSNRLNGYINSNFRKIIIKKKISFCSEINFLCLEKKLRKKLFVQLLIKEITRRLNFFGITHAIYTTGLPFLKSQLEANYFYFLLNNSKKLKFQENLYRERKRFFSNFFGLELIKKDDLKDSINLKNVRKSFKKKSIYKHFTIEDFAYWFKSTGGFKYTFTKKISLFSVEKNILSFFSLPCKVIKTKKPLYFYDSYCYYGTNPRSEMLLKDILVVCKKIGFDLFYILEGIYSEKTLLNLFFKKGNGKINFYFIGLKTKNLKPRKNGLIFF